MTGYATLPQSPLKQSPTRSVVWSSIGAPLFCLGIILTVAFSPGFLEADEINHFLIARDSLHDWQSRVSIWGRPVCTILYSLGTPWGIVGARLIAAGVTLLVCWGTLRLAKLILPEPKNPTVFTRHQAAWLWLALFAQPFFLLNSATVMTEMLLALCWVWAANCVVEKRIILASVVIGIGGLARPEGFFAIAAWPVFLWLLARLRLERISLSKGIGATFLAGLPVLVWVLVGAEAFGTIMWVRNTWPWSTISQYGASGTRFLVAVAGAGQFLWIPAGVAGVVCLGRAWRALGLPAHHAPQGFEVFPMPVEASKAIDEPDRRVMAALLLVLPVACFLLLHGVLGALGLFGSMALPRYFICIAPLIAILAVWGGALLAAVIQPEVVAVLMACATALSIVGLATQGYLPIPQPEDARYIDAAAKALPAVLPRAEWATRLVAFHPYVRYALNVPAAVNYRSAKASHFMETAPLGTVIISDSGLWENEGGPNSAMFRSWGYEIDAGAQAQIDAAIPGVDLTNPKRVQVHIWVRKRMSQSAPKQ